MVKRREHEEVRRCSICDEPKPLDRDHFPWDGRKFRPKCWDCWRKLRKDVPCRPAPAPAALAAESPGTKTDPAKPWEQTDLQELLRAIKRGPLSLEQLCNQLDVSPNRARTIIEKARKTGMHVHVEHDLIGLRLPPEDERVQDVVPPVIGERQHVGVISDTHLGSKYCLRAQLIDFVNYAYSKGVRQILHPGDVLDGCYRHAEFEMTHMGLDNQARDLFETLPALPGLTYHCITGNHDCTFSEKTGLSVGTYLSNFFQERGREDLFFYGDRGAFLRVRGATVHLWHPRSGTAYALSYALQKQAEKYSSAEKPQILLAGHWHIHCSIYTRGIHAIACPTFQGGGSAFGKSLGGSPAIGGMLLSWDLTEHGTIRDFVLEYRAYFERETPYRIDPLEENELLVDQRRDPQYTELFEGNGRARAKRQTR